MEITGIHDGLASRSSEPSGPVTRLTIAQPVLPCGDCVHAEVCVIRPLLDPAKLAVRSPASPHDAIRINVALTIECEYHLMRDAGGRLRTPAIEDARKANAAKMREAQAAKRPPKPPASGVRVTSDTPAPRNRQGQIASRPEVRERMRQAALARHARARAEREAGGGAQGSVAARVPRGRIKSASWPK
jgi:hypothetical protein